MAPRHFRFVAMSRWPQSQRQKHYKRHHHEARRRFGATATHLPSAHIAFIVRRISLADEVAAVTGSTRVAATRTIV
jgi:hypothetical protein